MNGLIEGIWFSKYTRFDVNVIEDYHVKGTFAPDAPSDIDYFGYRDTDFYVVKAFGVDAVGEYEMNEHEIEQFVKNNEHAILLKVQDTIDKMEKDNAI